MATLKIRHLVKKGGRWFFQPTPGMKGAGFQAMSFGNDVAEAVSVVQALNREWDAVRKRGTPLPGTVPGTMRWLAIEYKRSTWFTGLAPRTKGEADRHILRVVEALGNIHVATLKRRHVRKFHEKLAVAKSESQANESAKWLRRMLSYAVELELVQVNKAAKLELRHAPPRRVRWTREEVETFIATAIEEDQTFLALAVRIAYDTATDLSDILKLTWHDFDGEGVTFRRSKTQANPNIEACLSG